MVASRGARREHGTIYEHVCPIARGGMADVSLVLRREGEFSRAYALKRLLPVFESDSEVRTMFLEEARLAGLLRHPNVVSVLDFGRDDDGAYLVMDYVEGVPLTALLRRAAESQTSLPIQVCLRIAIQVAHGLHAAHSLTDHDGKPLQLVHRDVSPHNILVGFDGVARVTDFGIAKAVGSQSKTSTGVLKGKVAYMAPELLRFEVPDRRADLFSLGVVLYELLSGTRLYGSRDLSEAARRILNEAPPDLGLDRPEVPDALVRLSFSLLAKDRAVRPESAKIVAVTLEEILGELVAIEGPIDLEAFLAENVDAAERRERRALLKAVETSSPQIRTKGLVKTRTERGGTARALFLVGAGALVGVLGASIAIAVLSTDDGGAPRDEVASPAGDVRTSSETTAAVVAPLAPEPATDTRAPEPIATDETSEPPAEEPTTPSAMRERSRRRPRPAMTSTESMVPVLHVY